MFQLLYRNIPTQVALHFFLITKWTFETIGFLQNMAVRNFENISNTVAES
jgi:hypothetical protein